MSCLILALLDWKAGRVKLCFTSCQFPWKPRNVLVLSSENAIFVLTDMSKPDPTHFTPACSDNLSEKWEDNVVASCLISLSGIMNVCLFSIWNMTCQNDILDTEDGYKRVLYCWTPESFCILSTCRISLFSIISISHILLLIHGFTQSINVKSSFPLC